MSGPCAISNDGDFGDEIRPGLPTVQKHRHQCIQAIAHLHRDEQSLQVNSNGVVREIEIALNELHVKQVGLTQWKPETTTGLGNAETDIRNLTADMRSALQCMQLELGNP